jgi:hypothetical protein
MMSSCSARSTAPGGKDEAPESIRTWRPAIPPADEKACALEKPTETAIFLSAGGEKRFK